MNAIGGYFELELNKNGEYHNEAIRLNTGRNAFEYLILANSYSKVYLPFFTCDVLLEPLVKHKIAYEFYYVDEKFEPLFDYDVVKLNEVFIYTNYFGLKDRFINELTLDFKKVIIDNSQSFYLKKIEGVDSFYSPRKFFGIPDGAYLYSTKKLTNSFEKDLSFDRCSHLLKRIDSSAEAGYADFIENDRSLNGQEIKVMSTLTQTLLKSIDYDICAKKRIQNFNFISNALNVSNKLNFDLTKDSVPMVYPYWCNDKNLRQKLRDNKVYTPVYWTNVKNWCAKDSLEHRFVDEIIYLPIDQRYDIADLEGVLKIIM